MELSNAGKWRLCHNTQYPNSFCAQMPFVLKNLKAVIQFLVQQGDDLMVADLEKAYYFIPMAEASWPYLCFQAGDELLAAVCLVFGLGLAPAVFNKITRVLVTFANMMKFRVASFYDDSLWASRPEHTAETQYLRTTWN